MELKTTANPQMRPAHGASLVQTSLKDPFRVQNKHGFNSWKLGASERQGR